MLRFTRSPHENLLSQSCDFAKVRRPPKEPNSARSPLRRQRKAMKVDTQHIDSKQGQTGQSKASSTLRLVPAIAALLLAGISTGRGANILWVSDAPPAGFSGPGTSYTD